MTSKFKNEDKIVTLVKQGEATIWEIADLIHAGVRGLRGSERSAELSKLSANVYARTGKRYSNERLRTLAVTAETFPASDRDQRLTFSHYEKALDYIADADTRKAALAKAATTGLSIRRMLDSAGAAKPQDAIDPAKVTADQIKQIVAAKPAVVAKAVARNEVAEDAFFRAMQPAQSQRTKVRVPDDFPGGYADESVEDETEETMDDLLLSDLVQLGNVASRAVNYAAAVKQYAQAGSPALRLRSREVVAIKRDLDKALDDVNTALIALRG